MEDGQPIPEPTSPERVVTDRGALTTIQVRLKARQAVTTSAELNFAYPSAPEPVPSHSAQRTLTLGHPS